MLKLAAALMLIASVAVAQPAPPRPCHPRAVLVKTLGERYGETQENVGLYGILLLEVWSNRATGTWTIFVSRADGATCVVAAGEGWHGFEKPAGIKINEAPVSNYRGLFV